MKRTCNPIRIKSHTARVLRWTAKHGLIVAISTAGALALAGTFPLWATGAGTAVLAAGCGAILSAVPKPKREESCTD